VTAYPTADGIAIYFDSVKPGGGGYTVWPGSHLALAEYFEEHTYEEYIADQDVLSELDLGPPFEISGEAGDLVLWHHNLVHAAGPNIGDRIRMASIGRFLIDDPLEKMGEEFMSEGDGLGDPWAQYPALQDI
jgi:ectoine hydroxylase-related dioxygenase (phytanoyl-CoA dioxygenase family)